MRDIFGVGDGLQWLSIMFAALVAVGLLASMVGLATGEVQREPPAHVRAETRGATERSPRPPQSAVVRP